MTEPALAKPAVADGPPWLKPVVDYLALAAFFVGFFVGGRDLVKATGWLVGGSIASILLSLVVIRRVPTMPLIWGGAGVVFGGLTLVFHDPVFVKMKTTFVDLALGAGLLIGVFLGKNPLKLMMGETLKLSDAGWRALTFRYAAFFAAMAALNEWIWRTLPLTHLAQSQHWAGLSAYLVKDTEWVNFRIFGLIGLAILFSLTQVPLMMREMAASEARDAAAKLAELQE